MESATTLAAWWGAIISTAVAIWDVVKWKKHAPRLKIRITQGKDVGPDEFTIFVSNIGEVPALIERVWFRCFVRHWLIFKRELSLPNCFSLSGNNGFPPITLGPGEPWEVNIGLHQRLPEISEQPIDVRIDIYEAHRRRPYKNRPDARVFLEWIRPRIESRMTKG